MTLVALPPISLAVLSATSLNGVTLSVVGFVLAGILVLRIAPLPFRVGQPGESSLPADASVAKRRLGFAFRRAWISVLSVVLLYGAHWGVIVAYLPQRAELAGADIGLFFVADGLAILSARVPTGWLADRVRPIVLASTGIMLTAGAVALLTLPPATPLLVAAGALSGSGAGLVMTPMLVELSRRSGDADRGSAFSLFSASLAAALSIGSVGAAPIVGSAGFEVALIVSLVGLGLAAVVLVLDRGLRISRPRPGSPRPVAS
jgi:predicted MFS family arabinose efflux permease